MIALGDNVSDPVGSGYVLGIALAFFVAGCFLLAFTGASLGALHAFAAFIVLAIVASLNQLLPVLTGVPVVPPRYVLAIAVTFAAGFALLIAGFYGAPTFLPAAIVLGIAAFVWVVWNIARLIAGKSEARTRVLIACSVVAFAIAAGLGVSMAGSMAGSWMAPIAAFAPVHASLAIVGFGSLLILAVSYRFVPMFAVAHGTAYGRRLVQWLAVAATVAVAAFMNASIGLRIGLAGLLVTAVVVGYSHARTLQSRTRKRLDVSLRYGAVAWGFAIVALAVALGATWEPRLATAAVILGVLGWIAITTLGYGYKVAGFLAWQAAKNRDPLATLPPLSTAVTLPVAYSALALLAIGSLVAAICSFAAPDRVTIGFDIYAGGGLLAVTALGRLVSVYAFGGEIDGKAARPAG